MRSCCGPLFGSSRFGGGWVLRKRAGSDFLFGYPCLHAKS